MNGALIDAVLLVVPVMVGALVGQWAGKWMTNEFSKPLWMVDANHPNELEPSDEAYRPEVGAGRIGWFGRWS